MKTMTTKIPGVYRITCLPQTKAYIGASVDVQNRIAGHKARLRGNTHPLAALQSDFNLHGENQFDFTICEIFLSRKEALAREAEMLNGIQDWDTVYNTVNGDYGVQRPLSETDSAELLELLTDYTKLVNRAKDAAGGWEALMKYTGLSRASLWRIRDGKSKNLRPRTLGMLLKAINDE